MKNRIKDKAAPLPRGLLSGVALVALLASWSIPAQAAGDPETLAEIRALKAKLHQLEHRLDAQAQEQKREKVKAAAAAHAQPGGLIVKGDNDRLWPDKFYYKGITITPGGFFAAESVYRTRWMGADVNTPFQNIPFGNNIASHTDEFRFSARQSRFSLLVQGDVNPATHLTGYVETDFLGAAQTANSNESNSYNLRMRHLFLNADWDTFGLHLLAGQTWSLITMHSRGIRPDTALTPPQIDAQYIPGFVWARQPGIRLVKDFKNEFPGFGKDLAIAFSAEGAATTWAPPGPVFVPPGAPFAITNALPLIGAPFTVAPAVGGGLFNQTNNYSFNRMPDLATKVAWDPTILDRHIHVEAFGLLRDITNRAYYGNHSVWGGGFGAGVIVPVVPKLLDVQVSGMTGRGIGRYGAGQIQDTFFSLTGAPLPTHERMLLAGATLHATPQTDLYVFAGGEFAASQPKFNWVGNNLFVGGTGNWLYNTSGCGFENEFAGVPAAIVAAATACSNQTKAVRQITGGIWHTLYNGPFGKLKAGAQYSHTQRDGFVGIGGAPKGTENIVLTSFRYYPF
jgi:hypothetical protein